MTDVSFSPLLSFFFLVTFFSFVIYFFFAAAGLPRYKKKGAANGSSGRPQKSVYLSADELVARVSPATPAAAIKAHGAFSQNRYVILSFICQLKLKYASCFFHETATINVIAILLRTVDLLSQKFGIPTAR